MKVGYVCLGIFLLLSGCTAPSHQTDDKTRFCQHLTDYISSQYVTLPTSYERYRYDRHNATLTLWTADEAQQSQATSQASPHHFVDLSDVPSAYDVLFQHQGRDAVVAYCLTRY